MSNESKSSADIEYSQQGGFVSFYPVSDAGRAPWQALHERGEHKCFAHVSGQIIAQLKKAGYTVRKASKTKEINDEDLLSALGVCFATNDPSSISTSYRPE